MLRLSGYLDYAGVDNGSIAVVAVPEKCIVGATMSASELDTQRAFDPGRRICPMVHL